MQLVYSVMLCTQIFEMFEIQTVSKVSSTNLIKAIYLHGRTTDNFVIIRLVTSGSGPL